MLKLNTYLTTTMDHIAYPITCYTDTEEIGLSDEIILPQVYFRTLIEEFEAEPVLYLHLIYNQKSYLVTIGHAHDVAENIIFVPQWILDIIHYTDNATIRIEKANDEIPIASKIVVKPLDPMAFDTDMIACFETAFTNLHSIREHITIPVFLPNGDKIFAYVESVEPGGHARIVSGEVDVEFVNDFMETDADIAEDLQEPVVHVEELTAEQRRQIIRDSWINRIQNNATMQ